MENNKINNFNSYVDLDNTMTFSGQRTWMNELYKWVLFLFVLGNMILFGKGQLMFLGILLTACYIIILVKNEINITLELMLFFYWLIWGLVSYLANANSIDVTWFTQISWLMFTVIIMSFAVAGVTERIHSMNIIFFAIIIGSSISLLLGIIAGDFQFSMLNAQRSRATGLALNPNYFGYVLTLAIAATLYFFKNQKNLILKGILVTLTVLFSIGVIASGSRKSFVGIIILIILWLWYCYRKEIFKRPYLLIMLFVALFSLYFLTQFMLDKTYMGKRFKITFIEKQDEIEDHSRIFLYKEGLNIIQKNPVFGVGLGNFKIQSSLHIESHSDYVEIAASTGIIGFIIYFSIYILIWLRMRAIEKLTNDQRVINNLGLLKALFITIIVLGFGRPNFKSQITWVMFAGIIGYMNYLKQKYHNANEEKNALI